MDQVSATMPRGIRDVVAGGVALAVCSRFSLDLWRHFLNCATGWLDNRGDCQVGMTVLHDGAVALITGRSSSHLPTLPQTRAGSATSAPPARPLSGWPS